MRGDESYAGARSWYRFRDRVKNRKINLCHGIVNPCSKIRGEYIVSRYGGRAHVSENKGTRGTVVVGMAAMAIQTADVITRARIAVHLVGMARLTEVGTLLSGLVAIDAVASRPVAAQQRAITFEAWDQTRTIIRRCIRIGKVRLFFSHPRNVSRM